MKKYLYFTLTIIFFHSYVMAQDNASADEVVIDPESIKLLNDRIKAAIPIIQSNPTTIPNIVTPTPAITDTPGSSSVITKTNPVVKTTPPVITNTAPVVSTKTPEIITTPPDNALKNTTSPSTASPPPPADKSTKTEETASYIYSDWSGSIMFDNALVKSLDSALVELSNMRSDDKKVNSKNNSSNSNDVKSILDLATQNNISPSFYLGSIIFHSDNDWTIWINNKKITAEKRSDLKFIIPQLECVNVNEDYVTFSWKSRMIDNLSPGWREKLSLVKNTNNYYNENNGITFKDNEVITFVLYPNQTLSVYDMDILEGYVPEHIAATQKQEVN